jgi:DHA2 family multidrug resistance protein-like MFS transporter
VRRTPSTLDPAAAGPDLSPSAPGGADGGDGGVDLGGIDLGGIDPHVYAHRWRTLGVLCLSLTIVMVANMSLNLALPAIARDLDASNTALQWMVDAYALVFAGLLFTTGTLGDRFGRKGALQAGLVLFLVGSAIAATAGSSGMVIAGRGVMGVAAAFVMPSTLSIITSVFPPDERGRAIATWAGVAAGTAALGPTGSGLLLEHFWWGSVFLVNVPLVLAALIAGVRWVPTSRDPDGHPLDVPGALLSMVGVGALVYAIIEAPVHGWAAPVTLAAFAGAAVVLGVFAWRETTARDPMLDLRLFRDRRFSVASAGIALTFFAMFGTFFLSSQFLQLVLGLSALEAGLLLLPFSAVMLLVAPRVPHLSARYGVARVVPVGLAFVAVGLVSLSQLGASSHPLTVWTAFIPMAIGVAATSAPLTTVLMSAVPTARAGIGSAMNDTSRELGGALGVAVLGSVLTTRYGSALGPAVSDLPEQARTAATSGLAGALRVAGSMGGGDGLAAAAREAFLDGFGLAALVAAGLALLTGLAALRLLPRSDGPDAGAGAEAGSTALAQPTTEPGDQPGSRPAIPSTLSSSGASSGTGTTGPNIPERISS